MSGRLARPLAACSARAIASIWLARASDPAGTFFGSDAQLYQPGESFDQSCLPDGWQACFALRGLRVRVDHVRSSEPLWLEAVRGAPAAG